MKISTACRKFISKSVFGCLLSVLSGCATLPGSVPSGRQIEAAGGGEISQLVVPLDLRVVDIANGPDEHGFPNSWMHAPILDHSRFGIGDQIEVRIWEPTAHPLIAGTAGGGGTIYTTVSRDGSIKLPFAQSVTAAGLRPDELAEKIETAMSAMSNDVQAGVRLQASKSKNVTIQGQVTKSGVFPIETSTARLAGMLALAGVSSDASDSLRLELTRAGSTRAVFLDEFYSNASYDLALRAGDRIVVRPISDRYIILGASGRQDELAFTKQDFMLLQALAQGGGLRDDLASAKGVYLFRYEQDTVATALLGQNILAEFPERNGQRPVIYKLDMTDPAAVFAAQSFRMRNNDVLIATNAPFTDLRKMVSLFSTALRPAHEVSGL